MSIVPPLLLDIPESITTQRLFLRAPRFGDGLIVNEAIIESLAELSPWMVWARETPSLADSEAFVRQSYIDWLSREELQFFGFQDDKFVLGIELHSIDWKVPKFEVGYWMRTSAHGQGLMTEALRGLTGFAFEILGAKRVQIRCNGRNQASRRVALRAGFDLECVIKNNHRGADGRLQDTCVFALTREDEDSP